MLGYEIAKLNRRPSFPPTCPVDYQLLATRCWDRDPAVRPSFEEVEAELQRLQRRVTPDGTALAPADPPSGSTVGSSSTEALSARLGAIRPIPESPGKGGLSPVAAAAAAGDDTIAGTTVILPLRPGSAFPPAIADPAAARGAPAAPAIARAVRFADPPRDSPAAAAPPKLGGTSGGVARGGRLVFKSWDESLIASGGVSGPSFEPSASSWRGPQVRLAASVVGVVGEGGETVHLKRGAFLVLEACPFFYLLANTHPSYCNPLLADLSHQRVAQWPQHHFCW